MTDPLVIATKEDALNDIQLEIDRAVSRSYHLGESAALRYVGELLGIPNQHTYNNVQKHILALKERVRKGSHEV